MPAFEHRVTSIVGLGLSLFSNPSYFCTCNFVSGNNAHLALYLAWEQSWHTKLFYFPRHRESKQKNLLYIIVPEYGRTMVQYEVMCDPNQPDRSASLPFLAITTQHMGVGNSQYISYTITVLYMNISLMNPQCNLLWPHKTDTGTKFSLQVLNLVLVTCYVAITGYTMDPSEKYSCTLQYVLV